MTDLTKARSSEGCSCPPSWFKPVKAGEDRTGHHEDCNISREQREAEKAAVHTHGNGEIPVHGKVK